MYPDDEAVQKELVFLNSRTGNTAASQETGEGSTQDTAATETEGTVQEAVQ
mgnify:FL=1